MDPPPIPTTTTAAAATTAATSIPLAYPDSVESSPRSRTAEPPPPTHQPPPPTSSDEPPFNSSMPSKLRLMCSYGGHIIPRPHDKTLCYVGGETRIVVIDRSSSLSDLCTRLSKTLLNGRPFTLKYQLPNEELDSLISVTTDEDLENMIEEYDRICAGSLVKPLRIRLFLFNVKPESVVSMGALLDDAKSENWFVDALNNSAILPRGLSEGTTMDNLLNLDGVDVNVSGGGSGGGLVGEGKVGGERQGELVSVKEKQVEKSANDAHSMPNSPMMENASSSFGSSSSTPSMANLPPIRTRVEDNSNGGKGLDQKGMGIEEQFAQLNVGVNVPNKQDDGFGVNVSAPTQPVAVTSMTAAAAAVSSGGITVSAVGVTNEHMNRVLSDDERSDQGVPVAYRKPPLPLQPMQQRTGVSYNLPSPDSVASDASFASASSLPKQMYYQEQSAAAPRDNRTPASPTQHTDSAVPSSQVHMQQVQVPRYVLSQQGDQQQMQQQQPPQQMQQQPQPQQQLQQQTQPQQQFVHAGTHYIAHPASGQVPIPSYYQVYAAQPSQQQIPHPVDQQYPVYVMPMVQPPYNMSMQSNIADATTNVVGSNRTMTSANPTVVTSSAAYKDGVPPVYPTKTVTAAIPEMPASAYKTAATSAPQMVQIPSNQFQPQYMGYSQMHHPSQSISVPSSAASNYGYEYASSGHDQVYYSQHPAAGYPPQYQTMTPAAAMELSDASKQLPTEQQIRTSQP